jgi:predicted transposase YbfD/YdcC
MEAFAACFEKLEDPRRGNAGRHDLLELLMIAVCAVLCGGQTAVDMAEFGKAKEDFLRRFLKLEHGVPSHDTFSRVFRFVDPEQFRACFITFMTRFAEAAQGVIAIDGKTLRHSFDTASATSPLHMVSAWGCEQRLVLGQLATDAKSNEITAVPKLLDLLMLKGAIVTVDALNCQRDIARRIIDKAGDYVFALKANQETLYDDVRRFLNDPDTAGVERHTTVDGDHGRIETRTAVVSTDIAWLQDIHHWPGLEAIGKVIRTREVNGKVTTETAFYLASAPLSAERFGYVTRAHWGIENSLHWVLDVVMNEDLARNRKDNGPKNLAVLRHIALNIIRKDKSKGSTRVKFKRAGWNDDFLANLLAQI